MKKITLLLCLFLSVFYSNAQCPNGDAEMNDFSNWQGYTGANSSGFLNLSTFTNGIVSGRHTITTAGSNDPIVGTAIPLVAEGSHAIRLGDNLTGAQAEILSYTFTVPASFSFQYALVLQDPGHVASEQPFFSYWISTSSTLANSTLPGNLIVSEKKFVADANNSFFKSMTYASEKLVYKEWQTECVPDLSAYVGQTVTIYFATADCAAGGHFGYAYIDGLCKPNLPVPVLNGPSVVCNIDDPLVIDGSTTINENTYSWSASECDALGNTFGVILASFPITGNAGSFNLNAFRGLQNGHYYKVTLTVSNCAGSASASKIVHLQYPILPVNNAVICCGQSVNIRVDGSSLAGGTLASTYKWYDEAGNFLGNGQVSFNLFTRTYTDYITVTPTQSTKYRVVYEYGGCKNQAWIYVTAMKPAMGGGFSCVTYGNCSGTGTIKFDPGVLLCGDRGTISDYDFHVQQAQNAYTYSWNTGATTNTINVTAGNTYSVTVTSPCGSNTYTITPTTFYGAFPSLLLPNAMTASIPLRISQIGLAMGSVPAYNANAYELSVYDRWGARVYYKYITTCLGFTNGEIIWDGHDNNGNVVNVNSTYTYQLKLYNCNNNQTFVGTVQYIQ